jgi:hypothetical protein
LIFDVAATVLGAVFLALIIDRLVSSETLPLATMVTAGTTLLTGWLIQKGLRRQGEIDKISTDAFARSTNRIEELITRCLNVPSTTLSTDGALLQSLQLLANEITWFISLADRLDARCAEHDGVEPTYLIFKESLAKGLHVDVRSGSQAAAALRMHVFLAQGYTCAAILKKKVDFSVVRRSTPAA